MTNKLEWIVDNIVMILIIEAFIGINIALIVLILHSAGVI